MSTDRGIKEWAAVIAALREGTQSVMVRVYEPPHRELLLYPTFNFYGSKKNSPEEFNRMFQTPFCEMARDAGSHAMERAQKDSFVDIDCFAKVDEAIEVKDLSAWSKLEPYFIWSADHVRNYCKGSKNGSVWLWLCRIYKLPKALMIGRQSALPPNTYRHFEDVRTDNASPVLTDAEYERTKSKIIKIVAV